MNATGNKTSHRSGEQADRFIGYLGLFLIGAMSQGAEVVSHAARSLPKMGHASLK